MSQITTEQALQIPQQLKKQGSNEGRSNETDQSKQPQEKILKDDPVSLLHHGIYKQVKKVNVSGFKNELGQDSAFVKETLKNKLAEYNLNPNTKLQIKKDLFGGIEINGSLRPADHESLTRDLNNNALFKQAFDKLSQQEPTLNYVDNVVKISKAYGVNNNLFDSIISEKSEHNQLNDIAHRYESLKSTAINPPSENKNIDQFSDPGDSSAKHYHFVLNA